MKTELLSISKIFTERILRIPDYQRGYAWTEKELRDFWNDLSQLGDGKNHYTGVLTLEEVPYEQFSLWQDDLWIIQSKNYSPFYIVDGQQRLTTIIILIQAIIESIPESAKLNYFTTLEIRNKFIFETKDEGISRSYLFGYEKDNPSYEFLKSKIFLEKTNSSLPIQETIYTYNLESAKKFFLKNIENLDLTQLEGLFRKLTQNFLFNIYAISEDIDVFVAFETMNNRGKPLSHLELLKNRLIYLSTKFKSDDCEKQALRGMINDGWKSVYHYLGKNKDKILDDDIFLSNHFILFFNDLFSDHSIKKDFRVRRQIINSNTNYGDYLLEKIFSPKNMIDLNSSVDPSDQLTIQKIYDYVQSLKDTVQIWYCILNPQFSNFSSEEKIWLDKLNRQPIPIYLTVAPIIIIIYQIEVNPQIRVSFLKELERYLFTTTLRRYTLLPEFENSKLFDMSIELKNGKISSEKFIKILVEHVDEFMNDKDFFDQISAELRNYTFYRWYGIRYFLFEYELSLKEKSRTYRDKLNWDTFTNVTINDGEDIRDYYTVEHIYPQKPSKSCWIEKFKQYSEEEKKLLKNTLGNLLPLSEPKNQDFGNNCFDYKKGNDKSFIGYKYGSYSENQIANFEDWTAKEILFQGIKLLEFWEKRWRFDFGDKYEKAKFLLIDFVIKSENIKF